MVPNSLSPAIRCEERNEAYEIEKREREGRRGRERETTNTMSPRNVQEGGEREGGRRRRGRRGRRRRRVEPVM